MTEEGATMNAIEDMRQLFDARLDTLEAKNRRRAQDDRR
jgi:hypothetical protein